LGNRRLDAHAGENDCSLNVHVVLVIVKRYRRDDVVSINYHRVGIAHGGAGNASASSTKRYGPGYWVRAWRAILTPMEWRFIFVGVLGIDDFWWIGIAPLDTTTTAFAIAESCSSSEPWPSM
jgi:hypothetical protein